MTRVSSFLMIILAGLGAQSACSSEVQVEGGGGSGGDDVISSNGSTTSTGGGGASATCRALTPAGDIITLEGEGFTQFDLALALDGRAVLAQRIDLDYRTYFFDPWAPWTQIETTQYELDSLGQLLLAEGWTKGIAALGSNGQTGDFYNDVTGPWPAPVPDVAGVFPEAFVRSGDGYALASSSEPLSPWMEFSRLTPDGAIEWSRALGCGYGNGNQERAAAILPLDDAHLVAFTELKSGDCQVDVAERVSVARLDSAGQGEPTVVYESEGDEMTVVDFLLLPAGPILIFGEGIAGNTSYFALRLGQDGIPRAAPQLLASQNVPFARAGVARVEGGFVVARAEYEGVPKGRIFISLYDDTGALVNTSPSEMLPESPKSGVRVVSSPNGRSVLVAWTENVDPPAGNASAQILRFDCVEPGE